MREQAYHYTPDEARHYFAQMQAYQTMLDDVMFNVQAVTLNTRVSEIVSRAGIRVNCDNCGEEIINEREVRLGEQVLCRACACGAYYKTSTEPQSSQREPIAVDFSVFSVSRW